MNQPWDTGCSDFGDITQVMPGVHPHIGGAAGTNHGSDYRIADPILACVTSAKIQVKALILLLENEAVIARQIVERSNPPYKSIAEFLAAADTVDFSGEAVSYLENGEILLSFK